MPLQDRLEAALAALLDLLGEGWEFPDAAHRAARLHRVPQEALEAAYDGR